ncbi:MAG: NifB/NifX family molybdenum-iron cluster-binding protein [Caulobacteraceae bacterium]
MKIAVATDNGLVSGHFGKCEQFTVFETEGRKIIEKKVLDTSAHGHSMLPPFLASNGVKTVIAGGMGEGAKQKLDLLGIKAVMGAQGKVEVVVQKYLDGTLELGEGGCHEHHGHEGHHCNCHEH